MISLPYWNYSFIPKLIRLWSLSEYGCTTQTYSFTVFYLFTKIVLITFHVQYFMIFLIYPVAPSIPASLSVNWNNDGVGVFSLCLSGGVPHPKLQWAAGGATLTPLISRETEKVTDKVGIELHSVCALVKSAVPQGCESNFENLQNVHLCSE